MRWTTIVVAMLCACRSAPAVEPVSATAPAAATTDDAPKRKVQVMTETQIEILDPITFLPGSATIEPSSTALLDAIASTLTGNPSIKLVAVQAFGADALPTFQARLGAARAQAIVDALIARGIAAKRLLAEGDAQPPSGQPNEPSLLILERAP